MLVIAFSLYVRFTGLRDVFCHSPDELAEIMLGVRLHALPVTNLRDPRFDRGLEARVVSLGCVVDARRCVGAVK